MAIATVKTAPEDRYYVFCASCGWGKPSSGTYASRETAWRVMAEHNAERHVEVTE